MRIAVVGAGISGLTSAYELQKLGHAVDVFEKNDHVGGRMSSRTKDGMVFDKGANFLVTNYKQLREYTHELGIANEWINVIEGGKHRIIRNRKPYYLGLTRVMDFLRFSLISMRTRLRFALFGIKAQKMAKNLTWYDLSQIPQHLDSCTAKDYIDKHVGKEATDYVTDAYCGFMQFHRTEEISFGAMLALLKMYVTPEETFYMSITKGGMGRIPQELAKHLNVKLNTDVISIEHKRGKIEITTKRKRTYDAVICATPAQIAKKILHGLSREQKEVLHQARYSSTIVVSYKIPKGHLAPLHSTWISYKEHPLICGYMNEERKGEDYTNGQSLLSVFLHEEAARELLHKSDDDIYQTVAEQVRVVCPELATASMSANDLQRWPNAMPKFSHRYVSLVSDFWQYQGHNNIFLAGDYLNHPWTEGAARCGKKVAKLVHSKLQD